MSFQLKILKIKIKNIICNETENLAEQNENLNTIDKLGVDNETMKVEAKKEKID